MFFRAFLIRSSFECNVFQNDVLFSLLSHPILIADQKVDTLCRPSPLFDFGTNRTSCDTILAFNLTVSSASDYSLSPLIKSIIIFSNFSQYVLDKVGSTVAT